MRLAVLFTTTALTLSAATPYQRLVSEHFEILAPRDPEANAVLLHLEFARAFFEREAKAPPAPRTLAADLRARHQRPVRPHARARPGLWLLCVLARP